MLLVKWGVVKEEIAEICIQSPKCRRNIQKIRDHRSEIKDQEPSWKFERVRSGDFIGDQFTDLEEKAGFVGREFVFDRFGDAERAFEFAAGKHGERD
jgi:hypothetical protein